MTTEPLSMQSSRLYAEDDRDKKKEHGGDSQKDKEDKERNKGGNG